MSEEKKENWLQKHKMSVFVAVSAVLMLIGLSYAWLQLTLKGTKELTLIAAGTLYLELDDTMEGGISITSAIPTSDEEGKSQAGYTFTLENKGQIDSNYTIYLDDLSLDEGQTKMSDEFIKMSLTKDGKEETLLLSQTSVDGKRVLDLGNYSFDNKPNGEESSDSEYGSSYWVDSRLKDVLNNGPYYNRTSGSCPYEQQNSATNATTTCDFSSNGLTVAAKNMIEKTKWYLGSWNSEEITASQFYEYERGTTVAKTGREISWVGEVGLMYASDYGYAASGSNCLSTTMYTYNLSCASTDWLYNSLINQWTITPYSGYSSDVLFVGALGYINNRSAYANFDTRPSVYLKSNVTIASGDGSNENPYTLRLS